MSYQIKNVSTGQTFVVSNQPQWVNGMWECGSQRFADPSGSLYQNITYVPNVVGIGIFMASMTSQERAALRAHTDPLVKEFVAICTDPRITEIDVNLPSIQFDVNYAAGVVPAPFGATNAGQTITNPPIAGVTRAQQILAGNVLAAGD